MNQIISLPPAGSLRGEVGVPADKSIVHRAVLFNSIAVGRASVCASTLGRDNFATIRIMRQLGVSIKVAVPRRLRTIAEAELGSAELDCAAAGQCMIEIDGRGFSALCKPERALDCGNSGTTARLMCGVLAGSGFAATLDGDASLRKRPFGRVTQPLSKMGASFSGESLPLTITGGRLKGIDYASPIASAQVKSAILLAGLRADAQVSVREPFLSRDHTERMLRAMGAQISQEMLPSGEWRAVLQPLGSGRELKAFDLQVPGDMSQAGFFIVAALLIPGSEIIIRDVCFNATRSGLFHILRRMGGEIAVVDERVQGGEDIVDLHVRHSQLRGVQIDPGEVVACIDEIPILSVAAAAALGTTRIDGIGELRVKESDRVAMIGSLLASYGISSRAGIGHIEVVGSPSGLQSIEPAGGKAVWQDSGDHRILMAGFVAGLAAAGSAELADPAAVETSFPNFIDCFQALGCIAAGTEERV